MVLQPVGPEPPSVYWVRRGAALVLAFLLLLLGVRLLHAAFGGGAAVAAPASKRAALASSASPQPTGAAAAAAARAATKRGAGTGGAVEAVPSGAPGPVRSGTTPGAAAGAGGSGSPAARSTPTPSASVTPTGDGSCADSGLLLTVTGDARSYRVGTTPKFTLRVANSGSTTCTRDLAPGRRTVRVLSGSDPIWTSTACTAAGQPVPVTLDAKESIAYAVQWSGRRLTPGCATPGAVAAPGTYRAYGEVGGAVSAPFVFTIR